MSAELPRFCLHICHCASGPHIETELTGDGNWVRFDDVRARLQTLETALRESLVERERDGEEA